MSYAKSVVRNPWPVGMLAIVFSTIPFMMWLSLILIGLMTLCRGPKFGVWIAFCAAVPSLVIGFMGSPEVVLQYAIGGCFYTWLSAVLLWYARSWTMVLEATLVFALVGIVLVHLLIPDLAAWWIGKYQALFVQLQDQIASVGDASEGELSQVLSVFGQAEVLERIARVTTGVTFSLMLLFNLVNLLLARLWQIVAFDSNNRISQELTAIRMGYVSLIAFVLTVFGIVLDATIFWDFVPIFVVIFLCAGLSLLHFYAGKVKSGTVGLVIFYALMVILPTYAIPAVLTLAFIDTIFNLRQASRK